MTLRLRVLVSVVIVVAGVAFTVSRLVSPAAPGTTAALPVTPASYLGVYEKGVLASYQPVVAFARAAGRRTWSATTAAGVSRSR